jgi:aquaporin Z
MSDSTVEPAPAPYSLVKRLIAEVFGTFMLVFGLIGAVVFISKDTGPLGPALALGIAVLTAAYAVGSISGGHFNPAVTLGVAAAGRMRWADVVPYIIAQIVGGILATSIILLIASAGAGPKPDFQAASNGFGDHSPGGYGIWAAIIVEIVITAGFLWVILGVTAPGSTTAGFAPLAIGLTLTLFLLVAIPVDNASLNPARSIATAIYAGPAALGQLWVFLIAPVVGALIAGLTYKPLFGLLKK